MNSLLLCAVLLLLTSDSARGQNLQCPCVLKPGTSDCLSYDSRYQASSLEEAMATFGDLTIEGDEPAEDVPVPDVAAAAKCTTPECQNCEKILKAKLAEIGLLSNVIDYKQLNAVQNPCNKYRFSRNETGTYDYGKRPKKKKQSHDSDSDEDNSSEEDEKKHRKGKRDYMKWLKRSKRQAQAKDKSVVGTRYNISCTTKGVSTDAGGLLSLCSKCWTWRELPPNYFPRFINEIICDKLDSDCLSGYASCGIGLRTLEVIRNDTGVATKVSINGGSYCECRVASGSALQSLVVGDGLTNSLPAITPTQAA